MAKSKDPSHACKPEKAARQQQQVIAALEAEGKPAPGSVEFVAASG